MSDGQLCWIGWYDASGRAVSMTDKMWMDDISAQASPEPDDNFDVT